MGLFEGDFPKHREDTQMLSPYIAQGTWLHRLPAGLKLFGLAVASVVLLPTQSLLLLVVATGLGGLGFMSVGSAGRRRLLDLMATAGVLAVVLGLFQFVVTVGEVGSWAALPRAVLSCLRLLALVLLADLISITTPLSGMLQVIQNLLRPLNRIGLSTRLLSLAIGLMVRAAGLLRQQVNQTYQAFQVRTKKPLRLRLLPPAVRLVLRSNATMAEALQARALRQPTN